jgi:hypothetical protein
MQFLKTERVSWMLGLVLLGSLTTSLSAVAQVPAAASAAASAPAIALLVSATQWRDLSAEQQDALQPLAAQWSTIPEIGRQKWLRISRNFSQLTPEEKELVQSRMRAWSALSAQERSRARLNYADAKQLSQEEKKAKWEAYQALSDEEKRQLAQQRVRPAAKSTALAVRPVDSDKLAPLPLNDATHRLPRIDVHEINPVTLMPVRHHPTERSHT